MPRTYAQIRTKALDVLRAGHHNRGQFAVFLEAVDAAFAHSHANEPREGARFGTHVELSVAEKTLLMEVFWDLFREGIITLGINDAHADFPWFHVSERGKKRLETAQ